MAENETIRIGRTLRRLALGLVWMAIASGAVVFTEPAPVDLLTIILIGVLPLLRLVRITRGLVVFLAVWIVAGAAALVASIPSPDLARSAIHAGISVYLYAAAFVMAGFIALDPERHTRLVLHAYLWAAFIGALAGIIGYFGLTPGAEELFTRFDRAAGTFKDPNVFGAFLVPPAVYALHLTVTRPLRRAILPALMLAFLSFAILLSFSRGAWANLAVAMLAYGYFSMVFAPTIRERAKLMALASIAILAASAGLMAASGSDAIGNLLEQRAALTQSYDEGPTGRFGGQAKAKALLIEHPLGIGALTFGSTYHHEDVHNVYISMFLNAGWVGGLVYLAMVLITLVYGLNHALKRSSLQPLYLVVYCSFVAIALEGLVIDTDHWRHFYLLMALIWGLMVSHRATGPSPARLRWLHTARILGPARTGSLALAA